MKAVVQHAERDVANLPVLLPIVYHDERGGEIEVDCALEREPAFAQVAFALDGIESDSHGTYCTYK